MGTKVKEVMTGRPRCVAPETPLIDAAALMASEDIGAIPVLDGDELTGMVTDRDIVVRAVAEGKDPRGMPVREVATKEVVTIGSDADVSKALELMADRQVRRLAVVDRDDRLVGVIAQADIALEVKDKQVGGMVEEISKPPEGPRPL